MTCLLYPWISAVPPSIFPKNSELEASHAYKWYLKWFLFGSS
jgi:hypothetical protein